MHRLLSLLSALICISAFVHAMAFQDTTAVAQKDTLAITTLDTTRMRFIPGLGSLHTQIDSTSILHNSQFDWSDARYLGDLLWKIPGYHLRGLGEAGKLDQFAAFGLDGRNIPILLDGRPINEPYTGTMNLYDIPLEAIEQIEVMDAQDAVMYGSQGVGINLVTREYNNNRPVTKLRYMQGPFEYGLTDGMFAQNILRGTNLMAGLQRHATDGRFTNSAYDSWNIRSQLRYNFSDRFNIAASYFYHSADNGQNSGIDTSSPSLFNEVDAIVHDSTATESTSRHDFAITGIARLFPDSNSITQFSLFSMESDREYTDSTKIRSSSYRAGGRILQRLSTQSFDAAVGLDFIREKSSGNTVYKQGVRDRSALFGKLELHLIDRLTPAASFRTELQENGKGNTSFGLSLRARVGERAILTSSYSVIALPERSKTITYSSLGFDFLLKNSTRLAILGYARSSPAALPLISPADSSLSDDALVISDKGASGGSFLFSTRLWNIEGIWTVLYTVFENTEAATASSPILTTTGELAYRDVILTDVMELRTGVRFKYASRHVGVGYMPRYALYVNNAGEHIDASLTLDVFAVAHLGDAYLTLSWENILNEEYVTVARYPMPGRTFRFGFNWTFFD